ncbi:MAG: DUF1559 domain-containing protein, partial [Pirellulales bacterium]
IPIMICPSDVAADQFDLFVELHSDVLDAHSAGEQPLISLPFANYLGVFGNSEPDDDDDVVDDEPSLPGEGAFIESRPIRLAEFTAGLSNTMWVSERTAARLPSSWLGVDGRGEDALCRLVGNAKVGPNCEECDECEFSSRHDGGVNFLFGDGRVQFVSEAIDSPTYRRMAQREQ